MKALDHLKDYARKAAIALWDENHPTERLAVKQGFTVCFDLQIPLHFAKWIELNAFLHSMDGYILHNDTSSQVFTLGELYDYWIENIYSPGDKYQE